MEYKGTVLFIGSDTIGRGDDELGSSLMMNFLHQLGEAENPPEHIVLMNSGVKLAVEGSEVLDSLKHLGDRGTTVLACGTCLNFFGIADRQSAGKASNMPEITRTLLGAARVIAV